MSGRADRRQCVRLAVGVRSIVSACRANIEYALAERVGLPGIAAVGMNRAAGHRRGSRRRAIPLRRGPRGTRSRCGPRWAATGDRTSPRASQNRHLARRSASPTPERAARFAVGVGAQLGGEAGIGRGLDVQVESGRSAADRWSPVAPPKRRRRRAAAAQVRGERWSETKRYQRHTHSGHDGTIGRDGQSACERDVEDGAAIGGQ